MAEAQSPETLSWLRKIHDATQKLSYTGTFVYRNGGRSETSRITRFVDASGDIEKLEVLDGVPLCIVNGRQAFFIDGLQLVPFTVRSDALPPVKAWEVKRPEAAARLKALKPLVGELAERHGLPTENLLTPEHLRRFCWQPPKSTTDQAVADRLLDLGARPWQVQLTAPLLGAAWRELRARKRAARQAEYERQYARYADVPQPRVAASTMRVEIYPERRAVDLSERRGRDGLAVDPVAAAGCRSAGRARGERSDSCV